MNHLKPSVLDEAREMHGFTSDRQLADRLGMSESAIRNLRHGRTSPTVGTLLKLRKLTGIPLEALIVEKKTETRKKNAA